MRRFVEALFFAPAAACGLASFEKRSGGSSGRQRRRMRFNAAQLPTASLMHFLVKLVLAAPASFFSVAWLAQEVLASF
jgi:hypothetical protein